VCRSRFPKTLWIWKVPRAGFYNTNSWLRPL